MGNHTVDCEGCGVDLRANFGPGCTCALTPKVESYTYTVKQRSLADCQENQGARSDWWDETHTAYRVTLGSKLLRGGFGSEDSAKIYLREYCLEAVEEEKTKLEKEMECKDSVNFSVTKVRNGYIVKVSKPTFGPIEVVETYVANGVQDLVSIVNEAISELKE